MPFTRRRLLSAGAASVATLGATTMLPFAARAVGMGDSFATNSGQVTVSPVAHASFVMEAPGMVIYNDPVGGADKYSGFAPADLVLITHHHGDHYDEETLAGIVGENTQLLVNPEVMGMLSAEMSAKAMTIGNGESTTIQDVGIEAIPAYNLTEDRLKYHPKGRDNGYVLSIDGMRVYIAGDTEDIPEMRALTNIDLAFVPMNLPYTMEVEKAADAVREFAPKAVYPYHFKGSDPVAFEELVKASGGEIAVYQGAWYA